MLLGHYGIALAAKRAAPSASLGVLVAAAQFADLLWPVLLLSGKETVAIEPGLMRLSPLNFTSYPFSHSLTLLAIYGAVGALLYRSLKKPGRGALILVLALLVPSHWLLDFLVHRPDLPLTSAPGAPLYGLGLWNSLALTALLELGILGAGLWLYLRSTSARDAIGRRGPWIFCAVMAMLWVGALFGPPPPDVRVLAFSALALWLTVPAAAWIDAHRAAR